jgi:hypothetical protein
MQAIYGMLSSYKMLFANISSSYRRVSMAVLLLDPSKLLLYVHRLHLLNACSIFRSIWLSIIRHSRPLPAGFLFSRYVLACGAVIDIITLAGKALEVVRNICGVDCG